MTARIFEISRLCDIRKILRPLREDNTYQELKVENLMTKTDEYADARSFCWPNAAPHFLEKFYGANFQSSWQWRRIAGPGRRGR